MCRIVLLFACILSSAVAAPPTYKRDIAPIFKVKCQKCHGLLVKQKGLSLRSLKAIRKGGESGVVIVPGKPEASILFTQFSLPKNDPKRMPPAVEKAQLSEAEKKLIADWIREGAK
ncbi:MAG: hypothetical protein ACI8T1_003565 [Verrucomicrobiales bacterium]|jgi:hypothetical protein